MRYRGKRIFRLLQVSRAGLFSDLSAGDTCPLRIPVTQLLIKYAYQGAWMSGKGIGLLCRDLSDGLRFPPQISHEETAPFRQSHPKNPLAPISLPVLFLYCIQRIEKFLRKVSYITGLTQKLEGYYLLIKNKKHKGIRRGCD